MMQTSSSKKHAIPAGITALLPKLLLICCLALLSAAPLDAVEISPDGRILTGAGDGGDKHPDASSNSGGAGGKGGIGGGGGGRGVYNTIGTDGNGGAGGIGGGGGAHSNSNGGAGGGIDTPATTENSDAIPGWGNGAGGGGGTNELIPGGGDGGHGNGTAGPGMIGCSGGGGGYGSDTGGPGGSATESIYESTGGGGGGGAGRVLTSTSEFTVSSDITGGRGSDTSSTVDINGNSGGGGVGLVVHDEGTVTSTSRILGGNGGDTNSTNASAIAGTAGQGGAGLFLVGANLSHTEVGQHAGGTFNNYGDVSCGDGGSSINGSAGSGGHGILANNTVITNFAAATLNPLPTEAGRFLLRLKSQFRLKPVAMRLKPAEATAHRRLCGTHHREAYPGVQCNP